MTRRASDDHQDTAKVLSPTYRRFHEHNQNAPPEYWQVQDHGQDAGRIHKDSAAWPECFPRSTGAIQDDRQHAFLASFRVSEVVR